MGGFDDVSVALLRRYPPPGAKHIASMVAMPGAAGVETRQVYMPVQTCSRSDRAFRDDFGSTRVNRETDPSYILLLCYRVIVFR
ncbi:hypothetical protein [Ensifer sp. ENS03]|uniref:hypothetical protein n=1 Tax=Ensifer sp. ENS03 TaxID=2769283 RepID=UPI000B5B5002|nr:hypothetical protein [Ensifer sp. ENS03]MBD9560583.1 hypothetical protein [Ensifer sp. ENS03]OWZ90524.1 hypothetical protein B9J07_27155 [Sinorhizobium sp. LM21]